MMELKNKMFDEEEFESRNSYFGNARFVRKIVQPRIGDHSLHLIYAPCSDRSIEKNETIILQDLNTFTGPNAVSATGRTTIEF